MSYNPRRRRRVSPIYTFAVTWAVLSLFCRLYEIGGILLTGALSLGAAYLMGRISANNAQKRAEKERLKAEQAAKAPVGNSSSANRAKREAEQQAQKKSYGPEIDPIVQEGNRALSEMGRLYMSIKDTEVRAKINELMRITDKITQDAIQDPADIPQIKKFMNYYLPTTIKLLHAYDRMSSQGIEGENIGKSMQNINEMLDASIEAFKKRLDSLYANNALDIETDIDVMNQMLKRDGLLDADEFKVSSTGGVQQMKMK